jgi:hypothetical protein
LIADGSLRRDFVSLPDDNYYHPVRATVKLPIGAGRLRCAQRFALVIRNPYWNATCEL